LTNFGALRIAAAQIADKNGFFGWVEVWNTTWASVDADAATVAFLFVNFNGFSFEVY
jgi:hypothetical protein